VNPRLTRFSVPLLRWTLSIVVILESARFVLSSSAKHFFAMMGLPAWFRPALGIGEIFAALLFLVPLTTVIGSFLLLVIFALAMLIHFLHGQFDVGGLVVYAVAVLVCMAYRNSRMVEARNDRP
jgi:uncharacterized membrane protein YphA (DoxX/SURF4 family)